MVIKCKYAPTIGSEMGMNSNSLGLRNSIDVGVVVVVVVVVLVVIVIVVKLVVEAAVTVVFSFYVQYKSA